MAIAQMLFRACGFILMLFIYSNSNTQTLAISIDTLTGAPSREFPFDSSFVIKYSPPKGTPVISVDLFRITKKGCIRTPFVCPFRIFNLRSFIDIFKRKDQISYKIQANEIKTDSVGNLFIRIPQLPPNNKFLLLISKGQKPAGIDSVLSMLFKNENDSARKIYETINEKTNTVIRTVTGYSCKSCREQDFTLTPFDSLLQNYLTYFRPFQDSLTAKEVKFNYERDHNNLTSLSLDEWKLSDTLISKLISFSQQCNTCKDSLSEIEVMNMSKSLISSLLVKLPLLSDSLIYKGFTEIDSLPFFNPGENVTVSNRVKNLKLTTNNLERLGRLVNYLKFKNLITGPEITALSNYLSAAFTSTKQNLLALSKIEAAETQCNKAKGTLNSSILSYYGFQVPFSNLSSSTFSFDFDVRAGFSLKADFGFMAFGNSGGNRSLSGFSPFVGFHVNFRPLNTGIPYKLIDHLGSELNLGIHRQAWI